MKLRLTRSTSTSTRDLDAFDGDGDVAPFVVLDPSCARSVLAPATYKVDDGVDVYVAVERVKVGDNVKADDNVKPSLGGSISVRSSVPEPTEMPTFE